MAITLLTRKILWIKAGGRCSMCRTLLVTEGTDIDDPSVFGEEAHIVAKARSRPRAGTVANVDTYDNLILLCSTHHKQVDDQVGYYTVGRLKAMKQIHEKWISTLDDTDTVLTATGRLLAQPFSSLPPDESFPGSGLYALYYFGNHPAYAPVVSPGSRTYGWPVYIGRAISPGRRADGDGLLRSTLQPVLYRKLREHAATLNQVENLQVKDFRCRYLVIENIWVPLAEQLLIQQYRPVWNTVVPGFGLHSPGAGRALQLRSDWDEFHPGRSWAAGQQPARRSPKEILEQVSAHY
jgi:hypothetical protein